MPKKFNNQQKVCRSLVHIKFNMQAWEIVSNELNVLVTTQLHFVPLTTSSVTTSKRLCIKIIDCNVKKFGYNEHPLVTCSFYCIFLLVVSGTQRTTSWESGFRKKPRFGVLRRSHGILRPSVLPVILTGVDCASTCSGRIWAVKSGYPPLLGSVKLAIAPEIASCIISSNCL